MPDGTTKPTSFEEAQKVFCNFPIKDTDDAQPEQRSPNTASTHRPVVGASGHVIGWTDEEEDADAKVT